MTGNKKGTESTNLNRYKWKKEEGKTQWKRGFVHFSFSSCSLLTCVVFVPFLSLQAETSERVNERKWNTTHHHSTLYFRLFTMSERMNVSVKQAERKRWMVEWEVKKKKWRESVHFAYLVSSFLFFTLTILSSHGYLSSYGYHLMVSYILVVKRLSFIPLL